MITPTRFVLALLLWSSAAFAQADGGTHIGVGLYLSDPLFSVTGTHVHWVDGAGRALISTNYPSGITGPTQCLTITNPSEVVDLIPNVLEANFIVGARPGATTYTVFRSAGSGKLDVFRATCGAPAVALGQTAADLTLTIANAARTVPMGPAGDVYYGVSSGIAHLEIAPSLSVTLFATNAELEAASGITLAGEVFELWGLHVAADGSMVAQLVTRPSGRRTVMLRRSTAGVWSAMQINRLLGPAKPGLSWLPEADAFVFPNNNSIAWQGMPFVPASAPVIPFDRDPPFAISPAADLLGLITGDDGGIYAWTPGALRPLHYDAREADFDRDGLKADDEAARGLSDFDNDFDRDGYSDGQEVLIFKTDPKLMASVPSMPQPDATVNWAPSLIIGGAYGKGSPGCVHAEPGNLLCSSGFLTTCLSSTASSCFDPMLAPAKRNFTAPDGSELPSALAGFDTIAVSSTTVLAISRDTGHDRLIRHHGVFSAGLAVFDVSREQCPVVPNEAALADCANPKYRMAGVVPSSSHVSLLVYEPTLKRALVLFRTSLGMLLYAVGEDDVVLLGDIGARSSGMIPQYLLALPGGGFMLTSERQGSVTGVSLVDGLLRPVPNTQQFMYKPPQYFYRKGFLGAEATAYLLEPNPPGMSMCGAVGDAIFICDYAPPQRPKYVNFQFTEEVVPVGPALEKGEVLMWSAKRIYPYVSGVTLPDATSLNPDQYRNVGWLLWRVTTLGGVAEWLTAKDFAAKLSTVDQARLTATALGDVSSISVSADGLSLCLAEPGASRIWQLSLNATARTLETIEYGGEGSACAFDDSNQLVRASGASLVTTSGSLSLPAGTSVSQLLRQSGKWLVRDTGTPLLCIADDGSTQTTTLKTQTIAPAFDGVAYIDSTDRAFIGVTSELCANSQPRARLTPDDESIFTRLHSRYTFRSVTLSTGGFAIRPDGLAMLGARTVSVAGSQPTLPELIPLFSFSLYPTYSPVGTSVMPGTESFRLKSPIADLLSTSAGEIGAMALIPGADPKRDWGYSPRRPGTLVDPSTTQPPDAGTMTGPEPAPAATKPCGCDASGSVLAFALAALLLLRGVRRASPLP